MTDRPGNDDHRRAIGIRLAGLEEQVRRVHAETGDLEELTALRRTIDNMRTSMGVDRRETSGNVVATAVAFMLLDVEELRPQRLSDYGELDHAVAQLLDDYARRLEEIVAALAQRLERGSR